MACLLAVLIGWAAERTPRADSTVARQPPRRSPFARTRTYNTASLVAFSESHCVLCAGAPSPVLKAFCNSPSGEKTPSQWGSPKSPCVCGFPPALQLPCIYVGFWQQFGFQGTFCEMRPCANGVKKPPRGDPRATDEKRAKNRFPSMFISCRQAVRFEAR